MPLTSRRQYAAAYWSNKEHTVVTASLGRLRFRLNASCLAPLGFATDGIPHEMGNMQHLKCRPTDPKSSPFQIQELFVPRKHVGNTKGNGLTELNVLFKCISITNTIFQKKVTRFECDMLYMISTVVVFLSVSIHFACIVLVMEFFVLF